MYTGVDTMPVTVILLAYVLYINQLFLYNKTN